MSESTILTTVKGTLETTSEAATSSPETSTQGQQVSDLDPVSKATVYMATDIFSCHVIPIISLFGILGNILNFLVLVLQKRAPLTNKILTVLAVVDASFLIFQNLDYVTCVIRQNDVIAARNFAVLMLPHLLWVGVTLSRISATLTMVIAGERCLVVKMPLKVKVLVTSRVIYVTIALACVIPAVMHIPVFMRGEIAWLPHKTLNVSLPYLQLTDFALDNSEFLEVYKNLVVNVLLYYLPVAVVVVCTTVTIVQLRRYQRWRGSSSHAGGQSQDASVDKLSERDTKVSVTLVRICVVFIVCSIPGCVLLTVRLIQPEFDYYGVYSNSFTLTAEINEFFLVVNSSANFIIYMKSGDDFRRTLCRILRAAPCFRFLFRCVMRSDKLPATAETEGHDNSGPANGDHKGRTLSAFNESMASVTEISSVFTTGL